jgi:hypothetical protein
MNFDKYVELEYINPQELIDNSTKTKSLNSIKFRADVLMTKTTDKRLLSKIGSVYLLLEDAYKISMYKFQFKIFVLSLTKEIKNLEDYVISLSGG